MEIDLIAGARSRFASLGLVQTEIPSDLKKVEVDGGKIALEVFSSQKVEKLIFSSIELFESGVVESTVMVGDVKSPIISDGEADVLLGFEPVETYRAMRKCSADSVVVSNTVPVTPFSVAIGMGSYPDVEKLFDFIRGQVKKLITLNALAFAEEAGSALSTNIVMIGAMANSGALPIAKEAFEEIIRTKTKAKFVEANLRAFELGFSAP